MLIMNEAGIILQVNRAFTTTFGYENSDLVGKNFSVLFIEEDRAKQAPESELIRVREQGSSLDTNFVLNKNGVATWASGESLLVKTGEGEHCVVKMIHEIHAQKLLEKFLMEANEFINTIFDSVNASALLVIDVRLKIIRMNTHFFKMFNLPEQPIEGHRLADINHPLWTDSGLQQKIRELMVQGAFERGVVFDFTVGEKQKYRIRGKLINGIVGIDKRILLVIDN